MAKSRLNLRTAIALLLYCILLAACDPPPPPPTPSPMPPPTQAPTATAVPFRINCNPSNGSSLEPGDTAVLGVEGPPATYTWKAPQGTLSDSTSPTVIYTAPAIDGPVVISVDVESGGQRVTFSCTYTIVPLPSPTPAPSPTPEPDAITFQKGIALPSWWHEHYCQPEFGLAAIQSIAELGAEWVQLVPTWYVINRNAITIDRAQDKTTSDECLIRAIQAAHNNNLQVMLKPHVDSLDGMFRGELAPTQPTAWFDSYEQFLLHYAEIAQQQGVEIFVMGTELKSLSDQPFTEQWRGLIAGVRQRYTNRLTYAANWDQYDRIEFWDALDYVGIDAYFPLSMEDAPARQVIMDGWQSYQDAQSVRRWANEVVAFAKSVGRPVIFTEIGYASQDGAARQPWRQDNSQRPNQELQARLYDAAMRTLWAQPDFKGLYWWLWDMQPDPQYEATGYMPKESALRVLREWYQLDPPTLPPVPSADLAAPPTPAPTVSILPSPNVVPTAPPQPTAAQTPAATEAPAATATSAPPPTSAAQLPSAFQWESCTAEGWVPQTYEDSQGIASVDGSRDVAQEGQCSLRLDARLQAQHANFSRGEAYISLSAPLPLLGREVSCHVFVPTTEAMGPGSSLNGAQVFVKSSVQNNFRSLYGSWVNLNRQGWIRVSLVVTTARPDGGYIEEGFDPTMVSVIGIKLGTGGQAPNTYQYNGLYYVDNCTW